VSCSITVLEQREGPQFIFGLDMLRRHQCNIDLAKNELRFGSCNTSLPFLPEHEIPRDFKQHIERMSQKEAEENLAKGSGQGEGTSAGAAGGSTAGGGAAPAPAGVPQAAPAPAPAAGAPPAAAARPAAGGADADKEAKLQRLMQLGFDRETCLGALDASNGSEDMAASFLFGDMMM
jgi:DNA damage-inducible protein 1